MIFFLLSQSNCDSSYFILEMVHSDWASRDTSRQTTASLLSCASSASQP